MKMVAVRQKCGLFAAIVPLVAISLGFVMGAPAQAGEPVEVTVPAAKDNTLIQPNGGDPWSNGAGPAFFVGRVGNFGGFTLRRGVIAFDLSSIPAGATVTGASLQLYMQQTVSGTQTVQLRRLLADWGEGTSFSLGGQGAPAGDDDATWFHTFFPDAQWTTPGGDFVSTATASAPVGGVGFYTWSSAAMADDIQSWVDDPAGNFGWIVIGNEANTQTAKKFDSRQGTVPERQPALTITYLPPSGTPGDLNDDQLVNVLDLLILLGDWGACPGCPADVNNDDLVDVLDLLVLLGNWG